MLAELKQRIIEGQVHQVFSVPRILVVDDEPLLRDSLRDILLQNGYEASVARNGRDALVQIARQHFDAILLDLFMPDIHGIEVLDFIARRGLDTPVIVVSGDDSVDSVIDALRGGAQDFLRKPYQPDEMLKRVGNVIQRRRLELENRSMLQQMEQSEKWHRFLVNSSPDFIYTLDCEGRFTFVNDRVESLLGYKHEELLGQHYTAVIHDDDFIHAQYVFNERRTGKRASRYVELRLKCKDCTRPDAPDSRVLVVELNAIGMYEQADNKFASRYLGTYGVAKDISERKKAEETIYYQAFHDLLTGLPNRVLFKDRLNLAIAQARRNSEMFAVMCLDMDHFKVVNDTLGHVFGDELLLAVAARLYGCLREGDTLARMGGDEFSLLLPQIGSTEVVASIADKVIAALAKPFHIGHRELFATVSIGVSLFPNDGETGDSLIKHADIALYHAKTCGRDNSQMFHMGMNVPLSNRLSLENDLRHALERNQLVAYYQPQVNLKRGHIVGFECLIRWQHPVRGLVSPAEFIPLAEETGMIAAIGEWMLNTACHQLKIWKTQGLPPVRLAINISPRQMEQPAFVEHILDALHQHDLDQGSLEVEITENLIMKDVERTVEKLKQLSASGIKIAIDDFGTGYSSLNYLKKFPIHTIKIDQSFIADIERDGDTSIVTAIIAMAKGLHLNLIAEGVETESQLAFLRKMECDEIQGFLLSEPLAAQAATALLAPNITLPAMFGGG
ncbi:MAG TPA: EAL domain-containing protein [Sulfuriferula sp.]|nr:EAL domain-containing protein [Sulfuriferula sp.]